MQYDERIWGLGATAPILNPLSDNPQMAQSVSAGVLYTQGCRFKSYSEDNLKVIHDVLMAYVVKRGPSFCLIAVEIKKTPSPL